MRPVRLELEGFTAFRGRAEVDFTGVDLFAFTGPTGSGKTSLVDALTFALYGCVPRYEDRRLVAPLISQNANQARVRLEFTVAGRAYTAVRVVRRTKTGATTREARLEDGSGNVLAGTADEVTAAVESLLGLGYEHFVKCVVLPQGDFARFLHDKPERRQEVLVGLLDLGVYEEMGQVARRRADAAKVLVDAAERRLAELADATVDARKAAEERVALLQELRAVVHTELAGVAELDAAAAASRAEADEALRRAERLAAVAVPEGVDPLAEKLAEAAAEADAAARAETETDTLSEAAEAALQALPSRAELEKAKAGHELKATYEVQRSKGDSVLDQHRVVVTTITETLAEAESRLAAAVASVEAAEAANRAHAMQSDLVIGEACPVCRQTVAAVPPVGPVFDLDRARAERRSAQTAFERCQSEQLNAERELAIIEDRLASIDRQLGELAASLGEHPAVAEVDAGLAAVVAAEAAEKAARVAATKARQRRVASGKAVQALRDGEREAQRAFDVVRDELASLKPPARSGELAADWHGLAIWAVASAPEHRRRAVEAQARAIDLDGQRAGALTALAGRLAALEVSLDRTVNLRDAVGDALAEATSRLQVIGDGLAEADRLRAQLDEENERRVVADTLGRHLGARGFEKWVLDEALGLLVDGATGILLGLTGGQYSLAIDPRTANFTVIDHRNADEARPARTLSGGETFLASLALALALADRIALLAAAAPARLESIFLDEGFGTLDPDTLDTVASAIEELGAQGRMVGLISHVAELAERVPVRYEVTKVGNASTVQRLEQ